MSDEEVTQRATRDLEAGVCTSPHTPFAFGRAGVFFVQQIMGEHAMQPSSE